MFYPLSTPVATEEIDQNFPVMAGYDMALTIVFKAFSVGDPAGTAHFNRKVP
jgi:hypothetical protein